MLGTAPRDKEKAQNLMNIYEKQYSNTLRGKKYLEETRGKYLKTFHFSVKRQLEQLDFIQVVDVR